MRSTSINESLQSFWHLSSKDVLAKLYSNPNEGLTETEARTRLQLYGHNVLKAKKNLGTLKLLLSQFNTPFQFNTPLMYLLIFAASVSLFLYDNIDALIIFGIIIISAFLSFIQERVL